MGRRLALLIATYEYEDERLGQLISPPHDAEAFASVLRDANIADFEVTTLINKRHHDVGEAVGNLYHDRHQDDLTLLYFSGHGVKDDRGQLYLATTNTAIHNLLFTSVSAAHIDQAMDDSMARQNVLILDCCYSGAFPAGTASKSDSAVHTLTTFQGKNQGRGRAVMTASDATQYSFEGSSVRGSAVQSVFTRHLVTGLHDGSADLDGDGDITLDELYAYVHDRVIAERPQQRPKKVDNVQGRIVIARNVNWAMPPYLRHALASPIASDRFNALDALKHMYVIGNPLVQRAVLDELRRLVEDDSKSVSDAATRRLTEILAQPVNANAERRHTSSADCPPDNQTATPRAISDSVKTQPPQSSPLPNPISPTNPSLPPNATVYPVASAGRKPMNTPSSKQDSARLTIDGTLRDSVVYQAADPRDFSSDPSTTMRRSNIGAQNRPIHSGRWIIFIGVVTIMIATAILLVSSGVARSIWQ